MKVFNLLKLYDFLNDDPELNSNTTVSMIKEICEIGLGLKQEKEGMFEGRMEGCLEDDYRSHEAKRMRQKRAQQQTSGKCSNMFEHVRTSSNKQGGSTKNTVISRDSEMFEHVRTPNNNNKYNNNNNNNNNDSSQVTLSKQEEDLFNSIWEKYPTYRRGLKHLAIKAYKKACITPSEVKDVVLPSIDYIIKHYDDGCHPYLNKYLGERRFENVPIENKKQESQQIKISDCNIDAAEHSKEQFCKNNPQFFRPTKFLLDHCPEYAKENNKHD